MRLDRCHDCGHAREHHAPGRCDKPDCLCSGFRREPVRPTAPAHRAFQPRPSIPSAPDEHRGRT